MRDSVRFNVEVFLTFVFFTGFLLISAVAFGQTSTVEAPGQLPSFLEAAILFALPLLFRAVDLFLKEKRESRLRVLYAAVDVAYNATTNLAKFTPGTQVDDKVATAIGLLKRYMEEHGYSMTPAEAEVAKLQFSAKHAIEKQAIRSF